MACYVGFCILQQLVVLLLATVATIWCQEPSFTDQTLQPRNCAYNFSVVQDANETQCERADAGNSSSVPFSWLCVDLQSALLAIANISDQRSTLPPKEGMSDCASLEIPIGKHFISTPVYFGNTSVHLRGSNQTAILPTIQCDYTPDDGNSYLDYTVYFNQSDYFMMENLEMNRCAFPLRLDTVRTVVIKNTIFQ